MEEKIKLIQCSRWATGSVSFDGEHLHQLFAVGVDEVSGFFPAVVLGLGVDAKGEQEPGHQKMCTIKTKVNTL